MPPTVEEEAEEEAWSTMITKKLKKKRGRPAASINDMENYVNRVKVRSDVRATNKAEKGASKQRWILRLGQDAHVSSDKPECWGKSGVFQTRSGALDHVASFLYLVNGG